VYIQVEVRILVWACLQSGKKFVRVQKKPHWNFFVINIQEIRELTTNSKLIEFTQYVLSETGDKDFPDYKKMDLMKIAGLVSHIWVFDFRNGVENGVPYHFSGTYVDQHFGKNLTGMKLEAAYSGEDYEEAVKNLYHNVYLQKKTAYSRRNVHFSDEYIDKVKIAETIMFACSNNNNDIDFGIGFAEYFFADKTIANQYLLL